MSEKKKEKKIPHRNPVKAAKQQKQNRLVTIGFIITIVLIVGFAGYALLYELVIKENIPFARIDGRRLDNDYFQDRVRLVRYAYVKQYDQLYEQYQLFIDDQAMGDTFRNQLGQVQALLGSEEIFGELVRDQIINNEIVAREAKKMGISVTDAEIQEEIRNQFGFFPAGTPTPAPTATAYATPTLTDQQRSLLAYTPTPIQVDTGQLGGEDEPEEGADDTAAEVTPEAAEPTATATTEAEATPLPTATPYTEELYNTNYEDYITELEEIGVDEESFLRIVRYELLNQKVRDEVTSEVTREQEQVWARHILVSTEERADEVFARLDAGENWNDLAAEVSLDTSNKNRGGDLGWFASGRMVSTFEDAAFELRVGEISEPVETEFGWHIIQVLGHEVRPLSSQEFITLRDTRYQEWLESAKENYNIEINDVWQDLTPADPTIPDDKRVF